MLNYNDALLSSLSTAVGQIKPVIMTNNDQNSHGMVEMDLFLLYVVWFCLLIIDQVDIGGQFQAV